MLGFEITCAIIGDGRAKEGVLSNAEIEIQGFASHATLSVRRDDGSDSEAILHGVDDVHYNHLKRDSESGLKHESRITISSRASSQEISACVKSEVLPMQISDGHDMEGDSWEELDTAEIVNGAESLRWLVWVFTYSYW